jgi:DNA-binding GntR family transcriptional regulator
MTSRFTSSYRKEHRFEVNERGRRAPNAPPAYPLEAIPQPAKSSDVIYRDLRRAIVTMDLVPGTPISDTAVAETYGVSRTPVREALLRLAREGLVDVVPKSGTFVSRIPLSALSESMVARRALEEVTVRAASERATRSDILQLRAIVQRQQERIDAGDAELFDVADNDFHAGIAAAGQYPGIWRMVQKIRLQVDRYRHLTLPQEGRMQSAVVEHEAVLEAIARRDSERAVIRMNEHLKKLTLEVSVFRDLWPEYFIGDPVTHPGLPGA